jgi:hypothetical protein
VSINTFSNKLSTVTAQKDKKYDIEQGLKHFKILDLSAGNFSKDEVDSLISTFEYDVSQLFKRVAQGRKSEGAGLPCAHQKRRKKIFKRH